MATVQLAPNWNCPSLFLSQQVPGTLSSKTLAKGVHLANPKIHTRFIVTLIVMMMNMRAHFIHLLVEIRYNMIANDVFPAEVAMIPKQATMMVFSLIVLKFSSLIVSM